MTKKNQPLLTLVFCAALLSGQISTVSADTDLPELGDASSKMFSPEMEREIGRSFLKQINASLPTISDPILKYYLQLHMYQLAEHSQLKEKVLSTVLIDSSDINAFAAPGGVVGVNLGLFLYAEDIHEYSSVIAHELAHLSQRHFARGIEERQKSTLPAIASLIAAVLVAATVGGDAGIAALSSAQALAQNSALRYSRTREQEADRIGLNTLARADMDPAGMSRMFGRMQRAFRFTRKPPEFLLTHPLSETRIADARTQATKFPNKEFEGNLDYQLMRTRADIHYAETPKAAVKKYAKMLREEPDNPVAVYGLALAHSKAGEPERGLDTGLQLFLNNPDKILYVASYAELLIKADHTEQAINLLARQIVINPDNAPLTMLYAQALNDAKKHKEAERVLRRHAKVRPDDVDVWFQLAETAGLAGNILSVHQARAEYFILHGAYQRALQHLQYAHQLVSRDDYQTNAQIEQKITDLRNAIDEAANA